MNIVNEPCRHAIIDAAFDWHLCERADAAWPTCYLPGDAFRYETPDQRKTVCTLWEAMPPAVLQLAHQMLFWDVTPFGTGLVPDISLYGGGMQTMGPGDYVRVHLDAEYHRPARLPRRLNAVLFLSGGWQESWGGQLEFWSEERPGKAGERVKSIQPVCGRLVLFETSHRSYHGVSVVACPEGQRRKTLALWWYGQPRERAAFVSSQIDFIG